MTLEYHQPRFTILIPTIGRSDLLSGAIRSCLNQTLRDCEIIVADGSPDQSGREIAESFVDPRIRFLPVDRTHDAYAPFNQGYREATGEYVVGLDDDNYLLPWALELFDRAIKKSNAEIVSASHFYYYDSKHPRYFLRNSVGVVPFTGKEYAIDPADVLRSLFGFGRRGPGQAVPRLHYSATAVSRRVSDRALERLGFIVIPDAGNALSLQPILFAFSRSIFVVDHPVAIIGRFGVSMSQSWSTSARSRFRDRPYASRFSPVSGFTKSNATLESYLQTQRLLPDFLGEIPIDYSRFARLYLAELLYLDMDFRALVENWHNTFLFVKTLAEPERLRLIRDCRKKALLAPLVWLSRRLGLHSAWRTIQGFRVRRRYRRVSPRERLEGKAEFFIPFEREDHIDSIEALGQKARDFLRDRTGRDIGEILH